MGIEDTIAGQEPTKRTAGIAAVIVTHNRAELLARCVHALRNQTRRPDEIIVVDNASSDGTAEWLAAQPDLVVIPQGNEGSGGGQCRGAQAAMERGHEWAWLMDDDGFPSPEALATLEEYTRKDDEISWLNCLVVNPEDPARLAFGLEVGGEVEKVQALGPVVPGANPFNGTMIRRRMIEGIGLPCAALFIYGDEQEYLSRAERNGYKVRTHTRSIFYHPTYRTVREPMWSRPVGQCWPLYFRIRNKDAVADHEGRLKFSWRSSRKMALKLLRSIWKERKLQIKLMLGDPFRVAIILWAVWAAYRNDATKRFPFKTKGRGPC